MICRRVSRDNPVITELSLPLQTEPKTRREAKGFLPHKVQLTHCRGLPLKPPSLPSELSETAADLQSNHGAYVVARVWVSAAEYVMIIHGNEIMEPEELAQLGSVFDETWAAVSGSVGEGSAEQRTSLAIILLRLANL